MENPGENKLEGMVTEEQVLSTFLEALEAVRDRKDNWGEIYQRGLRERKELPRLNSGDPFDKETRDAMPESRKAMTQAVTVLKNAWHSNRSAGDWDNPESEKEVSDAIAAIEALL